MLNVKFKTKWLNLECTSIIFLLLFPFSGFCAEIDFAVNSSDKVIGLKIEGDIVKGDANKLLHLLSLTGPTSPIYLNSKGGDVLEAMKIGRIFRRLRLASMIPTSFARSGLAPVCGPKLSDSTNCVCASACFLIHAGSVHRFGNLLALHRPYLSPKSASNMTDTQHETDQKEIMTTVKIYLDEMEVPAYFTNLMMSRSSQDAYMVSYQEVDDRNHHLEGYVPSIEEITLSKCELLTKAEMAIGDEINRRRTSASSKDLALLDQINGKMLYGVYCQSDVVDKMRDEAFAREFPGKHWQNR